MGGGGGIEVDTLDPRLGKKDGKEELGWEVEVLRQTR